MTVRAIKKKKKLNSGVKEVVKRHNQLWGKGKGKIKSVWTQTVDTITSITE